jgi:putative ubiquitin-RnfH superfamily antitoxin RatB of RatAB toxin-antitoxin module
MKINKKYLGITALLSATAAASVFAAGATGTTSTVTNKVFGNRSGHTETEAERTEHQKAMATSLATALGTTPDAIIAQLNAGKSPRDIIKASGLDEATVKAQLDASRDADMKARLAADVASGKLTQAQADEIIANKDNHKEGEGRGPGDGKGGDEMLTNAATILGTTKDALQTQISAGKTLDAIVTASGITESDFHTKMDALRQTEIKAKLAAEVTAGTITQAQADQRLTDMANHKGGRGFGGAKRDGASSTTTNQ